MAIRTMMRDDLPALQRVLDTIELFPSDMLPDLAGPYLDGEGDDVWLTALADDEPVGLLYAVPEEQAEGAWNMRALGVAAGRQRDGHGRALVEALEGGLRERGARLLVVDTSGTDDYAPARAFYAANGYAEVARVPDFWTDGDAKVVFTKQLG